jgi:dienelactone hydrolase
MLHGAGGSRSQLLAEARRLAARGIVAMTIDSVFTRTRARATGDGLSSLRTQTRLLRQEIVDLRRAVDILEERPGVASGRIGFVGWSAGARSGAILAGAEPRLRALVLIAGGAEPLENYVRLAPAEVRPELRRLLTPVDPLRGIRRARPGTILFQAGRRDEIVPQAALRALAAAAPRPQDVRWYAAGHVPTAAMWADAREWLAERLAQ